MGRCLSFPESAGVERSLDKFTVFVCPRCAFAGASDAVH